MRIYLTPKLQNITLVRECPTGELKVTGRVGFYSDKGILIATRDVGGYAGLAVDANDLRDPANTFISAFLSAVEDALKEEEAKGVDD